MSNKKETIKQKSSALNPSPVDSLYERLYINY